jgi:hypothetical protein
MQIDYWYKEYVSDVNKLANKMAEYKTMKTF